MIDPARVDPATIDDASWSALSAQLAGEVIIGTVAALAEPRAIERYADVAPTARIRCAGRDDVATAVRFLAERGLPTVIRSGGHDFAGRSSSAGVVLDVSGLRSVVVGDGTVRIGAGTPLGDVYRELARTGQTIPAGCGPDVAVSGLTLGGGLGVLGRRHGLTCDSLTGADIVLADGSTVRCDAQQNAELFWALCGAGSVGFGVVTALRFDTVRAPRCHVVRLVWPADAAADVLRCWQQRCPDESDDVALSLLVNAGPDPADEPVVTMFGAVLDKTDDQVNRLADDIAAQVGCRESSRLVEAHGLVAAKQRLAELGPGPDTGVGFLHSDFVAGVLPDSTIEELMAHLRSDRRAGEARELDFSPWAGAYNRRSPDATAFCHRSARFLLKHTATLTAHGDAPGDWLDASWQLVHGHGTGGVYPNFPDASLPEPGRAYWGENLDRVRRVKQHYDSAELFAPAI